MPCGQKSKLRAREKRRQARSDAHGVQGTQATAAEEEGSPSSSSPSFGGFPQSSSAACFPKRPQRAPSTTTTAAGASGTRAGRGAKSEDEGAPSSSESLAPTERSQRHPLTRRVIMLLQFLPHKYEMKEPITNAEMMKINRRYKEHFPEFLRGASKHMELVFGLDLKEADSKGQSYALVSKFKITKEENMICGRGFPKHGLLMSLLGMIYMNGNRATAEEMWEFLNMLGIYNGRRHFIFGEPRKFLTKVVQEKHLEHRQVPNTDPPRYEFLWGPRAQAEASKTKILAFLAKSNDTDHSDSKVVYEEIWRDEERRAAGREWAGAGAYTMARSPFRVNSSRVSPLVESEADSSLCCCKGMLTF
ncbi:LOW QUALITY PROTEIN: melanoma-associated antigen B2-like [Trichechus inunguis]